MARVSLYRLSSASAFLAFTQVLAGTPSFKIADRDVELSLIRTDDRRPVIWPKGEVTLTSESVSLVRGEIARRLAKNGIEPDVGAYTILYELNPSLLKGDLPDGKTVRVPRIQATGELASKLVGGEYIVTLAVDPKIRQRLYERATVLAKLGDAFLAGHSGVAGTAGKSPLLEQIADVANWYTHIRNTGEKRQGPPMRRETILQLRDEADALIAILVRSERQGGSFDSVDRDQLSAIHDDIEREIRRYDDVMSNAAPDPDSPPCCRVEVVLKGDPRKAEKLRVYYALNGLFRPPPPRPMIAGAFPELGTGKAVTLRAKNYRFWAAPDNAPDQFMTEPLMVALEPAPDQKPTVIELLLK